MTLEKDSVRGEQPILSDKNISLKKNQYSCFVRKRLLSHKMHRLQQLFRYKKVKTNLQYT